jgi:tetratricopeptide (TPR) repeat protein
MDLCQQLEILLSNTNYEALHAKFLHLRGIINRDFSKLEQSKCDLQDALKLYEKLRDWTHFANALLDLGVVHYSQNEFSEAVANYRRVIQLSGSIQDLREVMIAHFNIGDINLQSEEYETAAIELQAALQIAQKKKLVWVEILAGLYLVDAQIALLELDSAQNLLSILKPLVLKQSSRCLSGYERMLTACLYWRRKQIDLAGEYFRRAFNQFETMDCQEYKARAYLAFARFKKEQGYLNEAKDTLISANNIYAHLNNQLGLKSVDRLMQQIQNSQNAI